MLKSPVSEFNLKIRGKKVLEVEGEQKNQNCHPCVVVSSNGEDIVLDLNQKLSRLSSHNITCCSVTR